jgi:hypothetical protein
VLSLVSTSLDQDLPRPPKVLKTKVYSYLLRLPRVSRAVHAIPLHTDLGPVFLVPRKPRTRRRLPKQVFDRLEAGRSRNEPYHYTAGDVRAIAAHVSRPPTPISQLEADLQQLSAARDHAPLSTKREACLAFRKNQAERREQLAAVQTQRAQQERQTLEERLARPSLTERIGEQTYTPIAPKPIIIDFTKTTTTNLIGIFKPKITTTALCLKPIIELEEHWSSATSDQRRTFESLADKIQSFGFDLETCAPAVTRVQWQSLDWGLKEIGKVSFAGLWRNYKEVLCRLVQISKQGYFNWL